MITGVVGLALFFVILFFYDSLIFNLVVGLISLIAVHEILLALKCTKNIPLTIVAMLMAIVPFAKNIVETTWNGEYDMFNAIVIAIYFVGVMIMFLALMRSHESITFSQITGAFFTIIVVPFAFVSLLEIRNMMGAQMGIYYTLLIFACAWGADTGAYFAGKFFGKRKLAPKISPNKTVEGLVGGVISAILFVVGVTVVYYFYINAIGHEFTIGYLWLVIPVAIIGSLVGVCGDLSASVIKRQCGIKDFGYIIPGHGGVMDRFDSVLFIAPFFYVVLLFIG